MIQEVTRARIVHKGKAWHLSLSCEHWAIVPRRRHLPPREIACSRCPAPVLVEDHPTPVFQETEDACSSEIQLAGVRPVDQPSPKAEAPKPRQHVEKAVWVKPPAGPYRPGPLLQRYLDTMPVRSPEDIEAEAEKAARAQRAKAREKAKRRKRKRPACRVNAQGVIVINGIRQRCPHDGEWLTLKHIEPRAAGEGGPHGG
jgi:hypothetical protein